MTLGTRLFELQSTVCEIYCTFAMREFFVIFSYFYGGEMIFSGLYTTVMTKTGKGTHLGEKFHLQISFYAHQPVQVLNRFRPKLREKTVVYNSVKVE